MISQAAVLALSFILVVEILANLARYRTIMEQLHAHRSRLYQDSAAFRSQHCQARDSIVEVSWRVDGSFVNFCDNSRHYSIKRYYKFSAQITFQAFGRTVGVLEPYFIVLRK